ncbi:MAG: hypothetical protein CME62_18050 [Halobacteriovoraceae bacterium]|nr:hypothetical protein [Halobacteriovoraceae bacterium]|tara:strand:+ start:2602 stop:3588 length:987 start_codon:yes stop_codon:yes gene_type:complete
MAKLKVQHSFLLVILVTLISCAKTDDEARSSAIREARHLLTTMDCSAAQDVLDEVDEEKDDPEFVSVYASAIACDAGYSDITSALPNFEDLDSDPTTLFGSMAAFASSNETVADAATYSKLKEAIDYILEADGGTQPSTSQRISKYGSRYGNDLSMQAFVMITVAFGKFLAFYGNADSDGVKGQGSITGGGTCYGQYEFDADVNDYLDNGVTGSCTGSSQGHADIAADSADDADAKRRLCEGIVLFHNLLDILANSELSSNDSLGDLSDVEDSINTLFDTATSFETTQSWSSGNVLKFKAITSQSACEAEDQADVERYFVIMFETNHQ